MIKIRLIRLLSNAKKYVWLQVIFQWISLIAQIVLIYCLTGLIAGLFNSRVVDSDANGFSKVAIK